MAKGKTKAKGAAAADDAEATISIAGHPRARRAVRRFRAAAGLLGFLLGAWIAHRTGHTGSDLLWRGLVTGVGAHLAGWVLAVTWWRGVILAELEAHRQRRQETREAADRLLRETAARRAQAT
jgi:hypothetical protein